MSLLHFAIKISDYLQNICSLKQIIRGNYRRLTKYKHFQLVNEEIKVDIVSYFVNINYLC